MKWQGKIGANVGDSQRVAFDLRGNVYYQRRYEYLIKDEKKNLLIYFKSFSVRVENIDFVYLNRLRLSYRILITLLAV